MFECDYMMSLHRMKKNNLAKLLSNNSHYIDGLFTINYLHFENKYSNIYPESLLLERSGDNNKIVNYFDITI